MSKMELNFRGEDYRFNVSFLSTEKILREHLYSQGIRDFDPHTRAYTDTWSESEARENGIGDPNCVGGIYLLSFAILDDLAHEATHMALGILSRSGTEQLQVTTRIADENEEDLCFLVGYITELLNEATQDTGENNHGV
jgi:hypothetical protein